MTLNIRKTEKARAQATTAETNADRDHSSCGDLLREVEAALQHRGVRVQQLVRRDGSHRVRLPRGRDVLAAPAQRVRLLREDVGAPVALAVVRIRTGRVGLQRPSRIERTAVAPGDLVMAHDAGHKSTVTTVIAMIGSAIALSRIEGHTALWPALNVS